MNPTFYQAQSAAGYARTVRPLPPAEAALARLFADHDALIHPEGCTCTAETRDDLHRRFLEVRDDPDSGWQDLCVTVLSHPWFLGMLHLCTRRACSGQASNPGLILDVKLNVIHRLVGTFARTRDLCYDPALGRGHFGGWLRSILIAEFPKAWKAERPRGHPPDVERQEPPPQVEPSAVLDLRVLINKLEDPYRIILMLDLQQCETREIAARLGRSDQWVYYRRRLAVKRLVEAARADGLI